MRNVTAHKRNATSETEHLLRSPRNAERLLNALREAKRGNGKPESVESLRQELGLYKEINYSYLNASIGSNRAALIAGNIPLTIPTKLKITVDHSRIPASIFR